MNDRRALLLSSIILAILMIVAGWVIFAGQTEEPAASPAPIPAFSRAEFSDTDLRGQVSIVNIFASWCPPCEAEHPLLMDLKANHGALIYGINYKDGDSSRVDYLRRLGNPYVAITSDREGILSKAWNSGVGVPETFIVDQEGMIRYHLQAPLTPQIIKNDILPLMRKLQGSGSITVSP